MSDPVSNAEIEDVLSSIRRLIAAGDPDQKDEVQSPAPEDDKLILTPAFRVFGGDPENAVNDDTPIVSKHAPTGRDIPVELLEQGDPSAAEVVELSDDADATPPFVLSFDTNMAEPGLQSTSDMPMPPADTQVDFEDNWDSDALGETAQVAFLHQRVTSVAAHSPSDEVEPETAVEDAAKPEIMVEEEVSTLEAEASAIDAVAPAVEDAPEVEGVVAQASGEDAIDDEDPKFVEVEPLQVDGDVQPEDEAEDQPILAEADDNDLTDEPADDSLGTEVMAASVDDAPMAEIVDDDSDFIDEDHLQEIVSRIVREELKGEMGVKITQAVRRMVRREVTRALSLEKFD